MRNTPERIRTPNLLIRSQSLYPIELPALVAERVGFEPTKGLSPLRRLAGARTKPDYATSPR